MMNRTTFRKLLYPLLLLTIFVVLFWLHGRGRISNLAPWGIALLVLSQIIRYPLRHFYQGLHAFWQRKFDKAESLFQTFLQDLERRPWIRHLIWWTIGIYSHDLEAMTWNNLGAIRIEKGQFEEAREHLERALEIDPKYPKPYFNLAAAAVGLGRMDEAERYFRQARELGYTGGSFDQFLTVIQQEYAALNTMGK